VQTAVLLSGGVDSAVSLALLHRQAERPLTAFYLKIWLEDELAHLGDCPWEEDLRHARAVCARLDVPLEILPLQAEYLEQVVAAALAELRAGHTPTPDVWCNHRIKFGEFLRRISPEYRWLATGHYAQVERWAGRVRLRRAPDPVKDQTYFLSRLTQEQLGRALFPVGHLLKEEVRALATRWNLSPRYRPDSQGICFLGKVPYREFVRFHLGERDGAILEAGTDRSLGRHRGHWFHTIGQRFGLGLGGGPWYVVAKDPEGNTLWVSHGQEPGPEGRREFVVREVSWIDVPPETSELQVRVRHTPELGNCRVRVVAGGGLQVTLAEPDPGLAPGQHAVFYDGPFCLGGGVIAEAESQAMAASISRVTA
jgi:tRNA-specific 2-thiouridylase